MSRRWVLIAAALLALAPGCRRAPADGWAVAVVEQNAEVDRLLAAGDRPRAAQLLAAIVEGGQQTAGAGADATIRRALLQDAWFRRARLALDGGDPEEALRHAEAGLSLGQRADLFTANLLVARGAAREARGRAAEALADYEQALRINQTLLDETLQGP